MIFWKWQNIVRHVAIVCLSFGLIVPPVWLLNKSYYTSIAKVNYWEEKQIVEFIKVILNNTDIIDVLPELKASITSVRFLAIKIERGNDILINKGITNATVDTASTNKYNVKDYNIYVTRRQYPNALSDYVNYLRCYSIDRLRLYSDINIALKDSRSLLYHRNLILLISQLCIIFVLEIIVLTISINYRLSQLRKSLGIK